MMSFDATAQAAMFNLSAEGSLHADQLSQLSQESQGLPSRWG